MWGRWLLVAALAGAPLAAREAPMTHHATGTFAVTITPEAQAPASADGLATSRLGLTKTFTGGLIGTARGTMLAAGTPGPGQPAAYVAIDQFTGTLDGRRGGFLLLHRGTMTKAGGAELTVTIAPDTGTGALAGIAGTLTIEVGGRVHRYDLAYTLPGG